jgi:hypothetical protein
MKPTSKKKLSLSRTTIRTLDAAHLSRAVGGAVPTHDINCPSYEFPCGSGSGPSRTDYPPCVPHTGFVCAPATGNMMCV